MATHSSILAWKISWTEEPGRLQSIVAHSVRHNWVDEHTGIHLRKKAEIEVMQLQTKECQRLPTNHEQLRRAGLISLQTSKGARPWWHTDFGLLDSRTRNYIFLLFKAPQCFTLLCHPRKLTYLRCIPVCSSTQLCLTLCATIDCSLPGSSVHEIFQARILEWVAICYSSGYSLVLCI